MTTTVLVTDPQATVAAREWALIRLVSAELLKLRRRRGLMALTALLTVAPMILGYGIAAYLHVHDPVGNDPAGGVTNFGGGLGVLSLLGGVAAVLIGATLGAGDVGAGVFRELVVTGRSRYALFAARIPAGLAILAVFVGTGFALAALASVAFSGYLPAPTSSVIANSAVWITITVVSSYLVALGVSSALTSRSMAIGILLGWQLALANLLMALSFLGPIRKALLPTSTEHFTPKQLGIDTNVTTTGLVAVTVIVAWTLGALTLGAWRTAKRDA
jgi:hypothetical protein